VVDPVTRLAVLGSPIAHSKSPTLHAAAYAELGLDWQYTAIEVDRAGLEPFLHGLDPTWRGFSLTMPLKRELVRLTDGYDEYDGFVEQTGVANTLLLADAVVDGSRGRRRSVFNTDVTGIVRALEEAELDAPRHVLLLGGGATAASAVVAVSELGARSVTIAVRDPARAVQLVDLGRRAGCLVDVVDLARLAAPMDADLVVSTLPGSTGRTFTVSTQLRAAAPLFDTAYHPWPSALAEHWAEAGGAAVAGDGMLLHQALLQVRIFVGGDPLSALPQEDRVLSAMRRSLGSAL
jgi:shikimate dehydrogenase